MKTTNVYGLNIADTAISLETELPLIWEEAFLPFRTEGQEPRYRVRFRRTDRLPPVPGEILFENAACRVHPDGKGGYIRSFYDRPGPEEPYAVAAEGPEKNTLCIDYLERGIPCVNEFSNCFFHVGLEGLLIREKKLCLHASLLETPSGGILFSGPSGIGKSTQAALWCRRGFGRLLNGDRPVVGKKDGKWTAWGSPYAGSSKCYVNQSCPVSAVILLEKAASCSLRQPEPGEKFRRLFSQIAVNRWDPCFTVSAMDLTEELTAAVPVYVFACTPAEEAADFLRSRLEKRTEL